MNVKKFVKGRAETIFIFREGFPFLGGGQLILLWRTVGGFHQFMSSSCFYFAMKVNESKSRLKVYKGVFKVS